MSQHTPEWDFYPTKIEGKAASISLDLAIADVAPVPELGHMLWVSIKVKEPDANGFPLREEAKILAGIEDELVEKLHFMDAVQVARLKSDGTVDFYFYAPENDQFEDIVLELMEEHPDYLYATETAEDPEWDEYLAYLYPDHYNYQSILNRRVVDQLQEAGDTLETAREVDHWLNFADEKNREAFAVAVQEKGFAVLQKGENPDKSGLRYSINISRADKASWEEVNRYVWELCKLAEKFKGEFVGWGCEVVK